MYYRYQQITTTRIGQRYVVSLYMKEITDPFVQNTLKLYDVRYFHLSGEVEFVGTYANEDEAKKQFDIQVTRLQENHDLREHFVDNFIFFDPHPIEKLTKLELFLNSINIELFQRNDAFAKHARVEQKNAFYGVNQIRFPDFIFAHDRNFKKRRADLENHWKEFVLTFDPVIEFMTNQINSKFPPHYPAGAEINILPPGGAIKLHIDDHFGVGKDYRMHLVISTNDLVMFTVQNKDRHLPQGTCFIFDNSKIHSVANKHDSLSRMHLVVDFKLIEEEE